jgi:hypothetical protein
VGQRVVQVAGQAVPLAADGQLLDGGGVAAQALVGSLQFGVALPSS